MTTDLVRRNDILPARNDWQTLQDMATALYESGLLPRNINNAFAALAIIEKGRELGVPPMMALSNINMIEGKPSADAQLIAGLIYRDHGDDALIVTVSTDQIATVQYKRRGWVQHREVSYTMEEARTALLTEKANWKKMPRAMLRARAITTAAHMAFQDTIGGLYSGEELGADDLAAEASGTQKIVDITTRGASVESCDAEYWNKRWHAAVKGTRFEDHETRHKFVAWFTQNDCDSLSVFLDGADDERAGALVVAVERRIAAEARKARADLVQELEAAVRLANDHGGAFEVPENVADLAEEDIRAMIAAATAVTVAATTVTA